VQPIDVNRFVYDKFTDALYLLGILRGPTSSTNFVSKISASDGVEAWTRWMNDTNIESDAGLAVDMYLGDVFVNGVTKSSYNQRIYNTI
jgi:hypothetical protein